MQRSSKSTFALTLLHQKVQEVPLEKSYGNDTHEILVYESAYNESSSEEISVNNI